VSESDLWQIVLYLHLLAMAFFVGGQLFLAVAIVPQARRDPHSIDVAPIARRFGIGALVALAVSIATGAALASHQHLWLVSLVIVYLGLSLAT
jgi:putative copper export protein